MCLLYGDYIREGSSVIFVFAEDLNGKWGKVYRMFLQLFEKLLIKFV